MIQQSTPTVADPTFFMGVWEIQYKTDRDNGEVPMTHNEMYQYMRNHHLMNLRTGEPTQKSNALGYTDIVSKQERLDEKLVLEYQNIMADDSGQMPSYEQFISLPAIKMINDILDSDMSNPDSQLYAVAERQIVVCRLFAEKILGFQDAGRGFNLEDTEMFIYCAYRLYGELKDEFHAKAQAKYMKNKIKYYEHQMLDMYKQTGFMGKQRGKREIRQLVSDAKNGTISFVFVK